MPLATTTAITDRYPDFLSDEARALLEALGLDGARTVDRNAHRAAEQELLEKGLLTRTSGELAPAPVHEHFVHARGDGLETAIVCIVDPVNHDLPRTLLAVVEGATVHAMFHPDEDDPNRPPVLRIGAEHGDQQDHFSLNVMMPALQSYYELSSWWGGALGTVRTWPAGDGPTNSWDEPPILPVSGAVVEVYIRPERAR